jgi:hypothetical protein
MTATEKKKRTFIGQMPEQNGVRMPGEGTISAQIWKTADMLSSALTKKAIKTWEKNNGKVADQKVIATLATPTPCKPLLEKFAGVTNDTNIRNQYSRWRKFYGIKGRFV